MSIIRRRFVIGLVLVSIHTLASAQPYSDVSLIVRAAGLVGLEYSDPPLPNADHVYFSSEQIRFEIVMINNRGTEPVRLVVGDRPLAASFTVKRPDGTDFELRLSNEVVRRGRDLRARLRRSG